MYGQRSNKNKQYETAYHLSRTKIQNLGIHSEFLYFYVTSNNISKMMGVNTWFPNILYFSLLNHLRPDYNIFIYI